jgi:hypothetical protein
VTNREPPVLARPPVGDAVQYPSRQRGCTTHHACVLWLSRAAVCVLGGSQGDARVRLGSSCCGAGGRRLPRHSTAQYGALSSAAHSMACGVRLGCWNLVRADACKNRKRAAAALQERARRVLCVWLCRVTDGRNPARGAAAW